MLPTLASAARVGYRTAMTDEPRPEHVRPDGVGDTTVEALGRLSEALEAVEIARGRLYAFHRMSGTADRTLGEAVDLFRKAGHDELADRLQGELFGRNLLDGRWSFQIVEEYDATYWTPFRDLERAAREELLEGRRHVYEAEMKERERTRGHPDHTAVPDAGSPGAT
jgi:hypothetical protein